MKSVLSEHPKPSHEAVSCHVSRRHARLDMGITSSRQGIITRELACMGGTIGQLGPRKLRGVSMRWESRRELGAPPESLSKWGHVTMKWLYKWIQEGPTHAHHMPHLFTTSGGMGGARMRSRGHDSLALGLGRLGFSGDKGGSADECAPVVRHGRRSRPSRRRETPCAWYRSPPVAWAPESSAGGSSARAPYRWPSLQPAARHRNEMG